jgi:hypothetical protein
VTVPGLEVRHGALSLREQAELLAEVRRALLGVREDERQERARVRRYGWDYLGTGGRLPLAPNGLYPGVLVNLETHDSVTVCEYRAGHGLEAHIDSDRFGEPVYTVSLGAGATMFFELGDERVRVPVRGGTLVEMSGPARWTWSHGMEADNATTRWSVVYRRRL